MNRNIDQITNAPISESARSAFKLVDALQLRDKDTQLPAATLFLYAFCKALDVRPDRLMEYAGNAARDIRRHMHPEVLGLIRYIKEELK